MSYFNPLLLAPNPRAFTFPHMTFSLHSDLHPTNQARWLSTWQSSNVDLLECGVWSFGFREVLIVFKNVLSLFFTFYFPQVSFFFPNKDIGTLNTVKSIKQFKEQCLLRDSSCSDNGDDAVYICDKFLSSPLLSPAFLFVSSS